MVKKEFFLTTTALQDTWRSGERLLFLGEWCKDYLTYSKLENKSNVTVPYHWQDKSKVSKDQEYLDVLCEELLVSLSFTLNKYHNSNQPLEYWRMIIGPWIHMFVPAIWDRWESLRVAFLKYKIKEVCVGDASKYDCVRYDYSDSVSAIQTQEMNYLIYSEIISFQYFKECKINNIEIELNTRDDYLKNIRQSKRRIFCFIDKFFSFFQKKYKVMFFTPYFNFWALIKISIKLKQAPRVFCEFKSINFFKNGRIKNRKLHISLPLSNDFEKFLVSSIFKHIPYVYLEGFSHLRKEVLKINFYADTIFTANAHIHCELFKLWCAEQIKANKSKIIISSHGGSIPSKKASFYSKHEEKISHKAVVWYKPIRVGQVRISANKFLSLKKNKAKKINDVTLIGLDAGMFAFGMGSGPKSSSMLEDFSHKVEFIKNISSDVFTHIKVFPYPNSPWNLQKRLVDIFGGGVISKLKNYNSVITNSKIIVCLYPQTTFSDAMFSETPTILLYDKRYWDFPPEFDDLLIQLEQAKIVFSDPLLAANHISNVFDNVDKWWEYKVTIEARKKFFNDCLLVDKDWASEWSLFFNQIQHSTKSLSHDSCSRKK